MSSGPNNRLVQLGARIKALRTDAGLTQSQLADAVGVVESYISKIEKGRLPYAPSEHTMRLLAKVLGADSLEMLALADKTPKELATVTESQEGREFFQLVQERELRGEDWQELKKFLRNRLHRKGA